MCAIEKSFSILGMSWDIMSIQFHLQKVHVNFSQIGFANEAAEYLKILQDLHFFFVSHIICSENKFSFASDLQLSYQFQMCRDIILSKKSI